MRPRRLGRRSRISMLDVRAAGGGRRCGWRRWIPACAGTTILVTLTLAACKDLDPYEPAEDRSVAGGDARMGPEAMRRYGCQSCHTIPGVRGANALVGPPLTAFGQRRYIGGRIPNEPEHLVEWIQNPQRLKPGTAMPNLGVSGEEARHIAAYLYGLR